MRGWKATEVKSLSGPIQKSWHSRGNNAYLIHDMATNSVIIGSKLTDLAEYLNTCARNEREFVSTRSLYESADKRGAYMGGVHKMRYLITRCDYSDSQVAFEQAMQKDGVVRGVVVQ